MKKTLVRLFSISLFVSYGLVGCGGDAAPAAVSGALPSQAFRGRTLDVTLSGSGTSWDDSTTVAFGAGITVNKVTAASPAALIANITVAADASIGPRDITVTKGDDAEPFKMAFQIESAVDVLVDGTTAQGSVVFLTIVNKDLEHLFDDTSTGGGLFSAPTFTNIDIKAPTGVAVNVGNVTPFRVDATLLIDVNATPGKFDLDMKSGPPGGTADQITHFLSPGVFDLAARTATAITGSTTFAVDKAYASGLYQLTPGGADHLITIDATPDDAAQSPSIVVLDNTGSFMNIIASGASVSWQATSAQPVYVIVYDGGGEGGYNVTVDAVDLALTTQTGGEGDNTANNTTAGAIVLMTPPVQVKDATLSSKDDVDCYKVNVTMGKKIHARTTPGDDGTDTTLQFYGTDGTTKLNAMPIDADYHEDGLSPAVAATGDYYVCVGANAMFYDAGQTHYNLIVTIE